jgi:hypothetical protein
MVDAQRRASDPAARRGGCTHEHRRRRALAWLAWSCFAGPATPALAAPEPISIVVKGGKPEQGAQVYKIKRGDEVTLKIVSDAADELHVHGYDLHLKLVPNQPATLKFVARRTGRFGFELHKSGVALGAFEVYPK